MKKEKSELEWRKYWKEKAEKLQKENIYLKDHIKHLELELAIWKAPRKILMEEDTLQELRDIGEIE